MFVFLYAIWVVASAVIQGIDVPGYVTLIVAVTGLGGLQMIMLGVIGEYIGRIYFETKKRPYYFVKESNLLSGIDHTHVHARGVAT